MKQFRWIILITIFLQFWGCEYIICPYQDLPDLGNGYKFETLNCKTLEIVNSENAVMIEGVILEYAFDKTYILVSQRPWNCIVNVNKMKYLDATKAFNESKFVQFWIINKKQQNIYKYNDSLQIATYSNVFGPFTYSTFLKKRKELGVPEILTLTKAKK